jgi:hypothetical protein
LPQGTKLKNGIVQRGLPFEEYASELQHHAEPECQRHGHGSHLFRDQWVGMDDDFGLATRQPGNLNGIFEPGRRPYPG